VRNNGHRTRQETASSCRISQCGADYLEIFDAAHSEFEDRFIAIGSIDRGLAIVVYTEPEDDLIRNQRTTSSELNRLGFPDQIEG
jgi:uncharacterized DUF497 family protein